MKAIELTKLEDTLNQVRMDDTFSGYRPAHSVAQLYLGRNDISNEEMIQVEAALDQLVQQRELDRATQNGITVYRSQKFGSKREEYLSLLERRAEEKAKFAAAALQFESLVEEEAQPFFERDYAWYVETT